MNYDKSPSIKLKNMSGHVFTGYEKICEEINRKINGMKKAVIAVDCYHGVYDKEILPALQKGLSPVKVIDTRNIMKDEKYIEDMLERNITDDRVFGTMCLYNLDFFIDGEKAEKARKEVECTENGVVLVYGVGASLVSEYSLLVYADMARWEIQMRFRKNKVANFCASNFEEDPTRKYKRAFFVDWRVIDRHKKKLYEKIDYLLDTNIEGNPKMITGDAFREGMKKAVSQPFRVVPYFDPGVWGGQWMKKVCGLDPNQKNFAWCFDCVPEENSLFLEIDGIKVEMPSINLVFYRPIELLGDRVHARFGTEFPIRFDFLDTIDGGNLSLQVHPLTEYIQETFGMHYTQDESYYLLDALEDASVYLGVKSGIDKEEFAKDLEDSKTSGYFEAEKYVNKIPAKKHDHFLIPAGTVHCSGKNAMVLEISATPYIFTFKLWDWGRLGLDGKPRPIHTEHGLKNIQFNRDTQWIMENVVGRVDLIGEGDGWKEERTGLHEREFIETRRHWFTKPVKHDTCGGVNVLNLVEGSAVLVESPNGAFEPFEVHYAETFIIPASVGEYIISPLEQDKNSIYGTIKAYVRV